MIGSRRIQKIMVTNMALSKGGNKMPKTEDGGFILDDSGMCPYSINEKPEKEKENKEEKDN